MITIFNSSIFKLLRKSRTFLLLILPAILAIPIVLLMRLLRPLVLIRFGYLFSSRIGHFAAGTELYLCERDQNKHSKRIFDIFYHVKPICNQQLKKMWDRTLHISPVACLLSMANRWLPGGKEHVVPECFPQPRDIYGLFEGTEPHLSFTPEEEQRGLDALRALGIPEGVPFVCLHSRDSAYLDATLSYRNWRHHDYRNSSIKNFIPVAEKLARRGYFVVRTGAIVKEPLKTTNPRVIDYSLKGRTEFLDILLAAKDHFFIGDSDGFCFLHMVFRQALVMVNLIPLEYVPAWASNYLFIPKKLWLRGEHRFLTFREILDSEIGRFLRSEKYERLGIEAIQNTPEEITDVAVEMDERLKGSWQTTEEDERLQRCFWSLFKPSELNQVFLSRIGAEFLRQNKGLLK